MKTRTLIAAIGMGLTLGASAPVANGTIVTFAFAGEITWVSDRDGILGGAVSVGDPFEGTYSFESTTPDSDPHVRRGLYTSALADLSGTIGSALLVVSPGFGNFAEVQNGYAAPTLDWYRVVAAVYVGGWPVSGTIGLLDNTGSAINDDILPVLPPDLESFHTEELSMSSEALGLGLGGDLTSLTLIPEPSPLWILLLGATVVGRQGAPKR